MYKISYYIMAGIAFIISSFLFLQSLFTTVRISIDGNGRSFYVDGKTLIVLALIGVFTGVLFLLYVWQKNHTFYVGKYLMTIMMAINPLFVLMARNIPEADSYKCLDAAAQLVEGNVSAFQTGNYMFKWPNQNGLVLFYYVISKLFGVHNYLLIQILNALLVDVMYLIIYRFLKKYKDNYAELCTVYICIFFPLTLYTTFVYGTIIGLVFSISAMVLQQIYFHERKLRYLILSAILIALAVQFKSNYLICFLGMVISYFFDSVRAYRENSKNRKNLFPIGIVALVIFLLFGNTATKLCLAQITDGESTGVKGVPLYAWVVMGLQESPRAPGWYNGYNSHVFTNNDFDYEITALQCKMDLQEEIKRKINNPKESVLFFSKKIASQWCEPAFQGFEYNREECPTNIVRSDLYYDITSSSGRINRIIYFFLDGFQSFVYLGILLYILSDREKNISSDVGLIIFIGGFLFHLLWEGSSSYTFPYFVLIIPYALSGFLQVFATAIEYKTEKTIVLTAPATYNTCRRKLIGKGTVLLLFTVCWFLVKDFRITEDTDEWEEHIRLHRFVPEGIYNLEPAGAVGNAFYFYLDFCPDKDWTYELGSAEEGNYLILTEDNSLKMEEINQEEDKKLGFRIERLSGGYCFRWCEYLDQVLTYDTNTCNLTLSTYDENNKNQIWYLKK